jgi:two-component system, sensor histidine kinase and response regulator
MIEQNRNSVVLVVDDNPSAVEMMRHILDNSGFGVLTATSGEEAIVQAKENHPDIILMDVMMPGMTGLEACEQLKSMESTCDIPVIFATALSETVDKVKGFEIGAVDYITKPLRAEEVVARITTHITVHRQRLEIEQLHKHEREYFEKITQMKDEIVRTASHDLKNPLSAISTSIYLLRRHGRIDDDAGKEYLDNIQYSSEQMRQLIVDLLDLAQIETTLAFSNTDVPLIEFLEESFASFKQQAMMKQIEMQFTAPESDITVNFDPVRMRQVTQNLLSNAIKYTPNGGKVELATEVREKVVIIQVIDNGLGIPDDNIPFLFDQFYRVHRKDEHHSVDGTGLGLSIAKSIVEKYNGELWVESELGVGSTFIVALPLLSSVVRRK